MTAADLVETLRARGVAVHADGDRLRLRPASAVTADELRALRQLKPEILALLGADTTPVAQPMMASLPRLDPATVTEVLGARPDPHVVAGIAWDVLDAVHEITASIRDGVLPPRRLIEGRPLADWLPLDDLARLLSDGGRR